MTTKILFVFGTRPEIIKLAPLIKESIVNNLNIIIVNTGQHYSKSMQGDFLKFLKIKPDYNLKINKKNNTTKNFVLNCVQKLKKIYIKENPNFIINQGDTNTVLASAIAHNKVKKFIKSKLVHVEAGIRSFDKKMIEEKNRIKADRLSDYLFAPTNIAKKNILKENPNKKNIYVVGNTIVDVLNYTRKKIKTVKEKQYFFLTLHRPELVDKIRLLKSVLQSIIIAAQELKVKIIFPVHPRTRERLKKIKIKDSAVLKMINPCNYKKSIAYQISSKLVITDSGGVQEESCILSKPCVTIRKNTERPETINIKSNILSGFKKRYILCAVKKMFFNKNNWKHPYQKNVSLKIIKILINSTND